MTNFFTNFKRCVCSFARKTKSQIKGFALAAVGFLGFSAVGSSAARADSTSLIDFSSLTTAIQTDVTSALTSCLPFIGLLLGAFLGYKMFKRFTGAKN